MNSRGCFRINVAEATPHVVCGSVSEPDADRIRRKQHLCRWKSSPEYSRSSEVEPDCVADHFGLRRRLWGIRAIHAAAEKPADAEIASHWPDGAIGRPEQATYGDPPPVAADVLAEGGGGITTSGPPSMTPSLVFTMPSTTRSPSSLGIARRTREGGAIDL